MLYFRFCTLCDSKRNSLRLQTQSASKRKWSVLTCTKKYTVSALTRFSWRSVSALTGFSRKKKRRARSAGICAVAQCGILKKSFTSFRSFSKFHLRLDTLLANQDAILKKTEGGKMSFCKLQKSLFRLSL